METPYISATVIISDKPAELKDFYQDIFGFTFEEEAHGELKTHYFTIFGENRLVIHSSETYREAKTQQGAIHFAVAVDSLDKIIERLKDKNYKVLKDSKEDFGRRIEFRDIDGNLIQAVELT